MTPLGKPRDLRIPGWFLAMMGAMVPVVVAAFLLGGAVQKQTQTVMELAQRMCRVEAALHITLWPGCPGPKVVSAPAVNGWFTVVSDAVASPLPKAR